MQTAVNSCQTVRLYCQQGLSPTYGVLPTTVPLCYYLIPSSFLFVLFYLIIYPQVSLSFKSLILYQEGNFFLSCVFNLNLVVGSES